MISILYLTTAAALVSVASAQAQIQQPQLVYEQHYLDAQAAAAQAPSFQPFPQESYGGNAPAPPGYHGLDSAGYPQPQPNNNNNNNQPMGFAHQQHQPGHYQNGPPPHQHAIGIPMPHPNSQQPFMHQQAPPPQFMNQPPPGAQMIPMGMSPHEFADRRGPLDNIMGGGGRPFKRGKKKPKFNIGKISRGRGPPVKMMEMNRIPKPPKYPLYDMPNIGMATPPPAPLMHPMGHMAASSSNTYSTFVKSPRGGPHNQRRNSPPQNRRRPHPEPQMRQGKRPPPPGNRKQPPRNHRRPGPPGKKPHFQPQDGYDHPMASNLDPQVNSPPLGRPLSFDEYMERPSHSFTDDPWNFDPFAAQYNSGMNTYAMKYNYDPLGMNVVDGSQSHLDPNKLSYPGDYFSLQDTSTIMKSPKTSQLGGWDHPPETYRTSTTKLLPPLREEDNNKGRRPRPGHNNRHRERFDMRTEESRPNSFNVFDSSPADSSIVKSEPLEPVSLVGSPGSGAPIEFSIESSSGGGGGGGDDHYQTQYNVGQEGTQDYWQSHSQSSRPYQPNNYENDHQSSQNSYSSSPSLDSDHAQSRTHDNYGSPKPMDYENSAPDLYAHARKEDYIPRERPVHDLSDHYNPMGEINVGMAPPSDDSDTLFRREGHHHGMRSTRQENTPMVEVEGLSLFRDVLRNANASGARKHLYSALLN